MDNYNGYGDSSIDLQIGEGRVRERPASMLGSDGLDGAKHGFIEIYGNALDEHSSGFGDKLDVVLYEDGSISVRDYGRGVPMGWNDKDHIKNWNWHIVYNELYGGAKYLDNQEELKAITDWSKFDLALFNYIFAVGLNGVGAASTQYTSEFFIVKSYRGGKCYLREFKHGRPIVSGERFNMFTASKEEIRAIPELITDTEEPDGTFVRWKPDPLVFTDTNISGDWLKSTCTDIANVCSIDVNFQDKTKSDEIVEIQGGSLQDLLISHCKSALLKSDDGVPYIYSASSGIQHGWIQVKGESFIYVCRCEAVIGITKHSVKHRCFNNSVYMSTGVQYSGINSAISNFMYDKARSRGVKLETSDYSGVFSVIVSSYSNHCSFRGQTKDGIDDGFIQEMIYKTVYDKLCAEYGKGTPAILDAVERILSEAEVRAALREQEKNLRAAKSATRERISEAFLSCEAFLDKNYEMAELWICEGKSARDALRGARNSKFQAIYPIRGRGLNVAKKSLKKILANKEIREIFTLLGTGFDLNISDGNMFDISKLRFGKIIFATDADEDGKHIRMLLFLTFYILAPKLLEAGMVYVAETPIFMITFGDGTSAFAYSTEELNDILSKRQGTVSRFKGLGEVNADVLRATTVLPESRKLVPLTCNFDGFEREWVDALFGSDKYSQRKSILQNALGYNASLFEDGIDLYNSLEDAEFEEETEYVYI